MRTTALSSSYDLNISNPMDASSRIQSSFLPRSSAGTLSSSPSLKEFLHSSVPIISNSPLLFGEGYRMAREGWRVGREEDAEDCVWFAGALITLIQQDLQSVRGPSNDDVSRNFRERHFESHMALMRALITAFALISAGLFLENPRKVRLDFEVIIHHKLC